jgi:hypothetical protein
MGMNPVLAMLELDGPTDALLAAARAQVFG